MQQPLVSIAMCTYNGAKYIAEQLDSILTQTHSNIELIVVDDKSTDETFDILTDYAGKDSRLKCFRNEVNLGYNKNFEKAIGLTTGAYIAISDQDDIWKQNKIEVLLNSLGKHWLVFSNSEWMEEDGTGKNELLLNNFSLHGKGYKAIMITNYMAGHASLFRREFLKHILPFPELGFYDWWMMFVALYHNEVVYVDQALTKYRKHSNSVIQNILVKDKKKLNYNLFKVNMDQYTAFESYQNLTPEDKDFISKLKKAFSLKETNRYSIPLAKILYKNYSDLFPNAKPRKALSKLNFVLKNSKL